MSIDFQSWLDRAAKDFLCKNETVFKFETRKKTGMVHYYSELERALAEQKVFEVHSYRSVREGRVSMPRPAVLFVTLDKLLQARPELKRQKQILDQAVGMDLPFNFTEFLLHQYPMVLKRIEMLLPCLEVYSYVFKNQKSVEGLLPRQIPHGQSTKLLGKEPLFLAIFRFHAQNFTAEWTDFYTKYRLVQDNLEFRFFAPRACWQSVELQQFQGVLKKEWAAQWRFDVKGTLIVENYQTFLFLSSVVKKNLVVWGQGWKATQLLELWDCLPQPVYYWGDIDKEGLEILNYLAERARTPIIPLLMDATTFSKNRNLAQVVGLTDNESPKKISIGNDVYELVCKEGLRIEQEQIAWPFDDF